MPQPGQAGRRVRVPDVLHLSAARAVARLAGRGLAAAGAEHDGVVVASRFPPRVPGCRGQTVALAVAGRTDAGARHAPFVPISPG